MGKDEISKEIRKLSDLLTLYQDSYYKEGVSQVSDREYDRLINRLIHLERENPEYALPDSPAFRVGSDLTNDFPEVDHTVPVLSLDKAYTTTEILSWIEKTASKSSRDLTFSIEEKIDGSSIVLYYEDGILMRAVTRGNGMRGNDITANVKTIHSVPLRLTEKVTIAVRGEIFLPVVSFSKINSLMETPYANPRNLAAGTLRRQKSSEVAAVPLDIFIYEGFLEETGKNHAQILLYLESLGFKVSNRIGVFCSNREKAAEFPQKWFRGTFKDIPEYIERAVAERDSLPYEIDGLVVKVNEIDVREELGYTGHHPRWAIAYKFESPEGETTVRAIDVQVGRTGRITPVARVDAVSIGGSTISNVTLHNQEYINMLELSVGDRVVVSRRGDVIPAVERVTEKNEAEQPVWKMPEKCPSCGEQLQRVGAHHFCVNPECPAQVKGRIFHFIGRDQMDIENFGPETAEFLIDKGYISGIADLYFFNYDRLENEPGFGKKKIELIKRGLEKSRHLSYRRVLPSLGIPELGKKAAQLLIEAGYNSIDSLLDLAEKKDTAALLAIKGIGEKTAGTILDELRKDENIRLIEELKKAGLTFEETEKDQGDIPVQSFASQVWCVTGSFKNFKPRSRAVEEIEKRGGRSSSSVTGKTTHLLAGENAGSKLARARQLGVRIVSEYEFMEMLKEGDRK
ncbi:MAG: DNA ligase (NAD(+)) LigA [Spirochaetes bacterium]|nr:MAG: DNA ligase (NAD(+)) LigA [Spirochaetota bacterium]